MDIISAHYEVGTYRGAAVACGTGISLPVMVFSLPLGAEARLSDLPSTALSPPSPAT
jgi:hypothetical protein